MRVTRIPVIVVALVAVVLMAASPAAEAQQRAYPPLCQKPLNRPEPEGTTTQPAAARTVAEGGYAWCQTGEQRCPLAARINGRRRLVDFCTWRASGVMQETPIVLPLIGSVGRYFQGYVWMPFISYGAVCDSPLFGRSPAPEACQIATNVGRSIGGVSDTAICRAIAGPWSKPVPPGSTGEMTVQRCRLSVTPYYCPARARAAQARDACVRGRTRSKGGRRIRVPTRRLKKVVDRRHAEGCTGQRHIDLQLEGLAYRTEDGRSLGWGYGAVTATGGGIAEETIAFGRTRSDRGQFGPYACDATVTLTAREAPGSAFDHWEGGACAGPDPVCVAPVNGARRERAIFRVAVRTLRVVNEQPQNGRVEGYGITCGNSGTRIYDTCTTVVRESESEDEDDLFQLDARANNYRTNRYAVASMEGCHGGARQLSDVNWRCFVKVEGADPVVTVTWKPG
jgi:hypothetical protein